MGFSSTFCAGLDENGLGPQLGPLVVTGVLARRQSAAQPCDLSLDRLTHTGDSKQLVAHHDVALGEAWARTLCPTATRPAEIVAQLSLDAPAALQAPCPSGAARQCWPVRAPVFSAPASLLHAVNEDRRRLEARGLHLIAARSVLLCAKRLHEEKARGHSLFATDLHSMERVAVALRTVAGDDVDIVCGKVGGMHTYPARFALLPARATTTECEGAALSRYRVDGLGRIAFVRDADGHDVLVALASLVGKYLREILMETITGFYRERAPTLTDPSGYRDPVTNRFVLATTQLRRTEGIPDPCFLRPRRTPAPGATAGQELA